MLHVIIVSKIHLDTYAHDTYEKPVLHSGTRKLVPELSTSFWYQLQDFCYQKQTWQTTQTKMLNLFIFPVHYYK